MGFFVRRLDLSHWLAPRARHTAIPNSRLGSSFSYSSSKETNPASMYDDSVS